MVSNKKVANYKISDFFKHYNFGIRLFLYQRSFLKKPNSLYSQLA
jgi:hypothetical protein